MAESDFSRKLRSHLQALEPPPDDHPDPETLVAYRGGALAPAQEETVQTHLAGCAECAALLLELAALEASGPRAGDDVSEHALEQAWRRQRERLIPKSRVSLWPYGGWLAAAILALVVVTLGLEVRKLRRASTDLYTWELPHVVVEQKNERDLGIGELPSLDLVDGEPGLILYLLLGDRPFTSFRVELFAADGHSVWAREGLSASEDLLILPVSKDFIPAGVVRVVVSGKHHDQDPYETIDEYRLRIDYR